MHIEKDVICEKSTGINHDYIVRYHIVISNKAAFKCETQFKVLYEIVQTWTNGKVTIQTGAVKSRIHIRRIKPYNTP